MKYSPIDTSHHENATGSSAEVHDAMKVVSGHPLVEPIMSGNVYFDNIEQFGRIAVLGRCYGMRQGFFVVRAGPDFFGDAGAPTPLPSAQAFQYSVKSFDWVDESNEFVRLEARRHRADGAPSEKTGPIAPGAC